MALAAKSLPDAAARRAALTDHDRTLLVEAGAGSGKTALMAGRVALLIAGGTPPRNVVAITFTEAAAAELLERIERFVWELLAGIVPPELVEALPTGLSDKQSAQLGAGAQSLDEITCTTIHGFCQQLIKPYPVEAGFDPGAAVSDPDAAAIAYEDLMTAWLSARFGRDHGADGLGRVPQMPQTESEGDFLTELLLQDPDGTLALIERTADFLKSHRTARTPVAQPNRASFRDFAQAVKRIAEWYDGCGVSEDSTHELVQDLERVAVLARDAASKPITGRRLAQLLVHPRVQACKKDEFVFKQWGRKGKWKSAARANGQSTAEGERLSTQGEELYHACGERYEAFCAEIGARACERFVAQFAPLRKLYADYKRDAALLDFDDLLHHARDLLKEHEPVRQALAQRYPRILVDEFQDTDPLQAEILWRLAGEGNVSTPWPQRTIRPGALFLVGDPKQAIYRFRGADVRTYLTAKRALQAQDPAAILEITANFRSQPEVLNFVNRIFAPMLDSAQNQPGFTALMPVRRQLGQSSVMRFPIKIEDRHKTDKGKLSADALRREEAAMVAKLVESLIGSHPVWDKQAEAFRPARAGDIALLAPTGSSLWIYERALELREIPIAAQAGKGFFRRQEVQDLIAVARAISDRRDTLALGALLRGPLVGLTDEQIADEIGRIQLTRDPQARLHLWTPPDTVDNPVLKRTLEVLQNLARKVRHTTPYYLMSEAIEAFYVRPILKARHRRGAERALANVELVLEMARLYAARGMVDFSRALWERWEDAEQQTEGRPDAQADAVSMITMHSSKGLEWPIVIPINSTTKLWEDTQFYYRRSDDSVHLRMFGYPGADYDQVAQEESAETARERVRLWYVALTRARDLLLLPDQSERIDKDWFSLVTLDVSSLPILAAPTPRPSPSSIPVSGNAQDRKTWEREAASIAASERRIVWRQPSRHEGSETPVDDDEAIAVGPDAFTDQPPSGDWPYTIQGGGERGLLLHKLMEEVLGSETPEDSPALTARARTLLGQLGLENYDDPSQGPCATELAATIERTLALPEIRDLRSRLHPEFWVYSGTETDQTLSLTTGIADAVSLNDSGRIDVVVDWKSDVEPARTVVEQYRHQVRDYLDATGANRGLIVFMTSGRVEHVEGV
jgi:exodeoxyribonuclease-5